MQSGKEHKSAGLRVTWNETGGRVQQSVWKFYVGGAKTANPVSTLERDDRLSTGQNKRNRETLCKNVGFILVLSALNSLLSHTM